MPAATQWTPEPEYGATDYMNNRIPITAMTIQCKCYSLLQGIEEKPPQERAGQSDNNEAHVRIIPHNCCIQRHICATWSPAAVNPTSPLG
eukprot:1767268-Pyramimonas_sp.AAC.1